jgi:glycosyl transferase family 87
MFVEGERVSELPAAMGETTATSRPRAGALAFWTLSALGYLLFVGALVTLRYQPLDSNSVGYLSGDAPYYLTIGHSILYDGDLRLNNQLLNDAVTHSRRFAIGRDGAWYPKHPILMPLVSLPFLWAWGPPGALLFNVIQLAAALVLAQAIASRFARRGVALAATWLIALLSVVPQFAYNYSADVFSTVIVLAMILAWLGGRSFSCGLLGGLALWAKLTNGVFWLACACGLALERARHRLAPTLAAWVVGVAIGIAPFLALNAFMFGSPLTTGYDRIFVYEQSGAGDAGLHSCRGDFDQPVVEGLRGLLLDPKHGLLRNSPVVLLALLGVAPALGRRRHETVLLLGASLALLLMMSKYRLSMEGSPNATRFLLVIVFLAAAPLACLIEVGLDRWRASRGLLSGAHS